MKKSIFLFFATLLCAISVNAKDIYADMSSAPSWYADAYIHYWDGSSDKYVKLEETGISKLLKATINDNYQGWRVCRYVDGQRYNDCTWISDKNVNKFIVNSNGNGGSSTTIIGIVTGGHIYFDNSETKWTGNIQFVVGHDSYSRTYEMTQISNTHLWYVNLTDKDYHTWGDAKYYGFIASGSKFGDGGWGSSNLKNATSYTKAYTSTYSLNDGAIYYCKMSATSNGSTVSIEYKGSTNDITKFAAKQAVKVRATKNDAYTDATGTWPITISTKGTYLSENGKSGNSDISGSKSNDGNQYDAVVTGKIIHTYSNLSDDYKFEGWGTADAPTSTDDSYEYNITANTTIYAYLTQKYQITFNGNANGSVSATADGQSLISSHKVVGGTSITLTATAEEGYEFTGWSDGATANPYTFEVTEDVTLTANFDLKSYTITATAENGTVTGAGTYDHGANVTLTATANEGYKFVNWTKGGEIVSTDATYTFTATEDVDLVANFKATTITLTTGNNDAVIAANIGNTVDVVIERSFTAKDGYYTLCVPFNMDPSVIGKAYYLGDNIKKHVSGEGIDIDLVEEKYKLSAGMPYLVLPKANMSELVVENVTIQPDGASGQNVGNPALNINIFFEGFYSVPAAPENMTNGTTQYYVGYNGYLYNDVVEKRGLCGLFTITDNEGNPAKVRARVVTREDAATGFENITNGENTTIKVIENGQLLIIRNGEKFNAQGQKL